MLFGHSDASGSVWRTCCPRGWMPMFARDMTSITSRSAKVWCRFDARKWYRGISNDHIWCSADYAWLCFMFAQFMSVIPMRFHSYSRGLSNHIESTGSYCARFCIATYSNPKCIKTPESWTLGNDGGEVPQGNAKKHQQIICAIEISNFLCLFWGVARNNSVD